MVVYLLKGVTMPLEFGLRTGLNTLGRNPTNDFCIHEASVSSFHAEITVQDDGAVVLVRDLQSTNGTFVDGQPVFTCSGVRVNKLWAGPRQNQYACWLNKELVINGRRLPLATIPDADFAPRQLWFTSNGEHVYGYGKSPENSLVAFFDNLTTKAETDGKPFSPGELLEAFSSDDSGWQLVGSNRPKTVARTFFRIEVGNRTAAQTN